uniref:Uncharacterized protein n=1 Tax=Tanacetum cinerariifolium TaxID=118510 RepID=A0A6L2KEJ9_TANCI|nr:hypothetical protein [Tanacetum cinerariifolium]
MRIVYKSGSVDVMSVNILVLKIQKFDLVHGNDIDFNFVFQELDLNSEDGEISIRIIGGGDEEGDGGESAPAHLHLPALSPPPIPCGARFTTISLAAPTSSFSCLIGFFGALNIHLD